MTILLQSNKLCWNNYQMKTTQWPLRPWIVQSIVNQPWPLIALKHIHMTYQNIIYSSCIQYMQTYCTQLKWQIVQETDAGYVRLTVTSRNHCPKNIFTTIPYQVSLHSSYSIITNTWQFKSNNKFNWKYHVFSLWCENHQ